ncbi:unnamed protein product [Trypanosoma congolense IL3000]|uniref:WGS project CAEQ00000000 data, annotated contig 1854 n=1 Tax=Trypanosoma congolense (strain IL3000) TaxID=1068625 RepID=F9W9E8_TRYCI|nr:unnamed protein product [Trypanosoma congolense IL3000]
MSLGTPCGALDGERASIDIQHCDADGEAAALIHPTFREGLPMPCAFTISNYRFTISPLAIDDEKEKNEQGYCKGFCFSLPLMSIGSWCSPRVGMTAALRAVFQQGRGQVISDADTAGGDTKGSSDTPAYKLKICTKHLWDVELLLQGKRLESTGRGLEALCTVTQLKDMPAFELYRKRYKERPEVSDINGGESDESSGGSIEDLMASVEFGWNLYDAERELRRQLSISPESEVPDAGDGQRAGPMRDLRPWYRLTNIQQPMNSYGRTPTYPFRIVAPNSASDELLLEAMAARSRARIPAVSFVHLRNGAVLARCSQPLSRSSMLRADGELCSLLTNDYTVHSAFPRHDAAMSRAAAAAAAAVVASNSMKPPPSLFDAEADEKPAPKPAVSTSSSNQQQQDAPRRQRTLVVLDCRPYAAALANANLGGGYESGSTHYFCDVKFGNIENIHAVSKSFTKLKELIERFDGTQPKPGFLQKLHETKWLQHIQCVMQCANDTADALERGESCLVHCTDGWDRTPQCVATAMLLLDPFYRTIIGFCVLLEKEFCSFGHKFAERCSHQVTGDTVYLVDPGVTGSDTEAQQTTSQQQLQPSPIFAQWMDVVFQIVRQFPRQFEFTPRLLEYLSCEVYSCLYGTFLCNNEKERTFEGVRLRTASIWTDIVRAAARERAGKAPFYFVNPAYDSATAWEFISKKKGCGIQRISPSCNSKRIVFWESFYLRHDGDTCATELLDALSWEHADPRVLTSPGVKFHEEWEKYFEQFIRESCSYRKRDMVYMNELLQNLDVLRAPQGAESNVPQEDTTMCHWCHKPFGLLGKFAPTRCSHCRFVHCSDCAVTVKKGVKLCRHCYNRHELKS